MDVSCLQHRLTDEERRTFEETGILAVEDALAPEHVRALTEAIDRIYRRRLEAGAERLNEWSVVSGQWSVVSEQ